MTEEPAKDPVRARRAQVARAAAVGQRIGYGLFGVAVIAFVVGAVVGLSRLIAVVVVASLVAGSLVLAPAIVLGFGVRAAERDDRGEGR